MGNAYESVRRFEEALQDYTGAPYAITTDTCTSAIMLCCRYLSVNRVAIPARTYISVPMSVIHAGGTVEFEDREWRGAYQLSPYPIWDCAHRFTSRMYVPGQYQCVSFHARKILPIGRGGAILTENPNAAAWFRLARFNGREEKDIHDQEDVQVLGWNCYMDPERAARGHMLLSALPRHNKDSFDRFTDLSKYTVFRCQTSSTTTPNTTAPTWEPPPIG